MTHQAWMRWLRLTQRGAVWIGGTARQNGRDEAGGDQHADQPDDQEGRLAHHVAVPSVGGV